MTDPRYEPDPLLEMQRSEAEVWIFQPVMQAKFLAEAATNALIAIGTPGIQPIIAALGDERPPIRLALVTVLGGIGSSEAVSALNKMRNDPDGDFRQKVKEILSQLGVINWEDYSKVEDLPSEIINEKDNMKLILVPDGSFTMGLKGSPPEIQNLMFRGPFAFGDALPAHSVYLDAYYIGVFPVTNAQFLNFIEETGYQAEGNWRYYVTPERGEHPVVGVSWNDALAYCEWAGLRLPTEAEWEKAARGIDIRTYPWGNSWNPQFLCWRGNISSSEKLPPIQRIDGCIIEGALPEGIPPTVTVNSLPAGASPYGCFHMVGNVCEFCLDWYDEQYYKQTRPEGWRNPKCPSGIRRVVRGGGRSSRIVSTFATYYRDAALPGEFGPASGFRVARSIM